MLEPHETLVNQFSSEGYADPANCTCQYCRVTADEQKRTKLTLIYCVSVLIIFALFMWFITHDASVESRLATTLTENAGLLSRNQSLNAENKELKIENAVLKGKSK